jgi:hypothetical protein
MLLKAAAPLWKKQSSAKDMPFRLTGPSSHPAFTLQVAPMKWPFTTLR